MKQRKRIFAIILAILMVFTFAGCSDKATSSDGKWITEKEYYYVDENGNWTAVADESLIPKFEDSENSDGTIIDVNNSEDKNDADDVTSNITIVETSKFQTITDYMGNDGWDHLFKYDNMYIDSMHPDVLEDDFRMRRFGEGSGYLTYKVDHIGEFIVQYSYGVTDRNAVAMVFSVSKDGKTWKDVKANTTAYSLFNGDTWIRQVSYFGGIDTDNQYLKITIPAGGKNFYEPNINFVQINSVNEKLLDELGAYVPDISKPKTIYVDSSSGKDTNAGTSEDKPLKSLYAASQKTYAPGSKILLKSGCSFSGSLTVKGSGTSANPITVSSYGSGAKPQVNARGGSAVSISGDYITVTGLKITNKTGKRGVDVTVCKPGATKGIKVTSCDFADINVNFTNTDKDACGIYFKAGGRLPTWFDGITVQDNTFNHVARCGITVITDWSSRDLTQQWGNKNDVTKGERYAIKNVVIRNNKLNEIGGDGIFIYGCDAALVERNVISNSALFKNMGHFAWASIWCHSSDNCVFQYNEVYGNDGKNGGGDLQAFDADLACNNNIFQYNYSHDNEGGFMLLCSYDATDSVRGPLVATKGTIVRYNLSVNDAIKGRSVFDITSSCYDSYIYNNTVYCGKEDVKLVNFANYDKGPDDSRNTVFTNNIFYAKKGVNVTFGIDRLLSATFNNNVFYNIEAPNDARIKVSGVYTEDPKFVSVGATGNGLNAIAAKYKLESGSYALTSGIAIKNNGGKDIFGNKVNDKLMGAILK